MSFSVIINSCFGMSDCNRKLTNKISRNEIVDSGIVKTCNDLDQSVKDSFQPRYFHPIIVAIKVIAQIQIQNLNSLNSKIFYKNGMPPCHDCEQIMNITIVVLKLKNNTYLDYCDEIAEKKEFKRTNERN